MKWPLVKLGTLVTIKTGKLDANAAHDNGAYPFFTCSRETLKINDFAFDCDAILIAGNGDLNVKHYKGKFNAYQRTYVMTIDSPKALESRYLYYFMDKYVERLREISIGGVIKYIKIGMLTDAEIPLPPLEEQKRIAAILDKTDAIRRKRQQAIQLADDFLRAVFLDMFGDPVTNPKGWKVKKLGDVIKLSSGNGLSAKDMAPDGCYPVYGGNGVNGYHSEFMFDSPQLVIGRVGVYCGAIHITEPKSWITDNALYIKEYLEPVNIHYLAQLLEIANLNQYAGRAAQPLVSGSRIYPLEMIFPPLEKQNKFQQIKEKTTSITTQIDTNKKNIESLFNALGQKAFRGEL